MSSIWSCQVFFIMLSIMIEKNESEPLVAEACRLVPYNRVQPQSGSCSLGPPGSHILPFSAMGVENVPTVIARHLPKAGSSAVTTFLVVLWRSVLRQFSNVESPQSLWNTGRVVKVTNFQDHWYVNSANTSKIEFVVAREPLDRFASGYYFRERHGKNNDTTSMRLLRLANYLTRLPDGEFDVHLFPQAWFFCNCIARCRIKRSDLGKPRDCLNQCGRTEQDDTTCMNHIQYVIRLENIKEQWEPFVRTHVLHQLDPQLANQIVSKVRKSYKFDAGSFNGGRWRSAEMDPNKNNFPTKGRVDGKSVSIAVRHRHNILFGTDSSNKPRRLDAAGFDAILSISGASTWPNITEPLCRYLRADYLALSHFYKIPEPCLPWLQHDE
mmetsp:Transcript_7383/g.11001  ORF Transcript_7383/g.11001 Transcript_7383/m.11001 type:complete len:382 (-) Transcript_7383:56-1201(-)